MENNTNNRGEKAKSILQKMFHFRVKVDNKQGKPIVNVSSIFGLACLLFAPHMTIVGALAALLLGYQFRFESEEEDKELEERIRNAARNVKTSAVNAARSIRTEIDRARAQNAQARTQAEAEKTAEQTARNVRTGVQEAAASNEELLRDLQSHAEEPATSNPAATTFHSAYAASAGSVPVLRVEESPAENTEPTPPASMGGGN
ncbi:MAG: DUF4342 domain-containing protein [Clostridia bacterium]|nr:DUF4342 domain-containing protein [Clostridia bacterium]